MTLGEAQAIVADALDFVSYFGSDRGDALGAQLEALQAYLAQLAAAPAQAAQGEDV